MALAQADPWQGFEHRETHSQYDETGQNLVGTRIPREDRHGGLKTDQAIPPIREWLKKHGLPELEITNAKDMDMIELWDDRVFRWCPIPESRRTESRALSPLGFRSAKEAEIIFAASPVNLAVIMRTSPS